MSSTPVWRQQELMLGLVATALGPELASEMAFVGGCTTALMLTDAVSREEVRSTDDVDLIVHVLSSGGWYRLLEQLQARGFQASAEDAVICRLRLARAGAAPLIVDFMPDDASVLGFSNRWYAEALRSARDHALPDGTRIRLVSPPFFLATKLEAWKGRGNDDPLGSRDVEDILTLVDGRAELLAELRAASPELQQAVAQDLAALMKHRDFLYAVQGTARGDASRITLIFQRLKALASIEN